MESYLKNAHKEVDGLALYFIGEIAVIVMDRGENRVNSTLTDAFNNLLDEVENNESCKGLITTGKGKFYSNGLDLDLIATLSSEKAMDLFVGFSALLNRLLLFPIPTLAAINGHAYAAGALIALAHDLRTMNSEKGWLCLNEVFINRRLGTFNLLFLETKIGKGKNYTDALVLGKRFTGQEAYECGMLHSIQPIRLLLQDAIRVLKSFYGNGYPRESLKIMKEDVYRGASAYFQSQRIERQDKGDSIAAKL